MPLYFPTLDEQGGIEKKVYEIKSLLMAYAQFQSYLQLSQLHHAFVRNSLFQEHCYQFVIEPSATSLLFSFVASYVVFDVLGIL